MSLPTITVRIAFASFPTATPSWTDVSGYVRSFRIRRGREDELGRIEAGTAEVVLDNRDRRFDPTYTSGPYYGLLLPGKRINIQAVWNSVTYDLYTGFVEAWPPDWPRSTDSTTTIRCADLFKALATPQIEVNALAETLSGDRIGTMLNLIFWPFGEWALDAGATTISGVADGTVLTPLQHISEVCESEQGIFFVAPNGYATFHSRHHRLTQTLSTTSQGTFGDSGAELPYGALEPSYDDTYLYNDIRVTPAGGTVQTAADTTSRDNYFQRTLSKSVSIGGGVSAANNEAASMAAWLLANYKDPQLRFTRMTIDPQAADSTLWPQVLGREIGDRITVKRRPPGGGNVITQDCFVESVNHVANAGPLTSWKTEWTLSPVDTLTYWVLNSTTLSVLGSTTRLGY